MYQAGHVQKSPAPAQTAPPEPIPSWTPTSRPCPDTDDALGPARGILISAGLGLLLWGLIFLFVWLIFLR